MTAQRVKFDRSRLAALQPCSLAAERDFLWMALQPKTRISGKPNGPGLQLHVFAKKGWPSHPPRFAKCEITDLSKAACCARKIVFQLSINFAEAVVSGGSADYSESELETASQNARCGTASSFGLLGQHDRALERRGRAVQSAADEEVYRCGWQL